MEFGLLTEFQAPAGRTDAAAFDESMAKMRLAERVMPRQRVQPY